MFRISVGIYEKNIPKKKPAHDLKERALSHSKYNANLFIIGKQIAAAATISTAQMHITIGSPCSVVG